LLWTPGFAHAQTFSVLHSFGLSLDGGTPYGAPILDRSGNLYGTTAFGGYRNYGVVYRIDPSGNETILHTFSYKDGCGSFAGLVSDKSGNLYGTEFQCGIANLGTIFRLAPSGRYVVLYAFGQQGSTFGGSWPMAPLVRDNAGNLYGTTSIGGAKDNGTAFKVDHRTGTETLLYSFGDPPDGQVPTGSLIFDSGGNLYGTTDAGGGFGWGTIFKLDSSGTETVLYNFTGGSDGASPTAGLLRDNQGNLFGTTYWGGLLPGDLGLGTVFKLDPSGTLTILHQFGSFSGDGDHPFSNLVRDRAGNFYGTTYYGGLHGYGAVYKLASEGTLTILHSFAFGEDGAFPNGGLAIDTEGNLYGTATEGGAVCCGVAFKITP
jgi:uncharacterized repeat protein (TIGR03803 family)